MFGHTRVQRLLSSYHDGELAPLTAARVKQHLMICDSCRQDYKRLAMTANLVRHLPRIEAPAALARILKRRIDEEVRGMVPILRGELLSCRPRPVLFPSLSLGALLTLSLVASVFVFGWYQEASLQTPPVAFVTTTESPTFFEERLVSPRVRDGCLENLPYTDMVRGQQEGTFLTYALIDKDGAIHDLHVIDQSGDERFMEGTLQALRDSGFEPARVGGQNVAVNFLYMFTSTVVRPAVSPFISNRLSPPRFVS